MKSVEISKISETPATEKFRFFANDSETSLKPIFLILVLFWYHFRVYLEDIDFSETPFLSSKRQLTENFNFLPKTFVTLFNA